MKQYCVVADLTDILWWPYSDLPAFFFERRETALKYSHITFDGHSEHLGQSLDQASDVCRRSNMLKKLTCIAGSSYSSTTLYDMIP